MDCVTVTQSSGKWRAVVKTVVNHLGFSTCGEFIDQVRNYEDESIIIRNAVASVFLLAALSFPRASLGVVFFLSQLCRFEVARSVPLSQS